jgi:hypothetical protein
VGFRFLSRWCRGRLTNGERLTDKMKSGMQQYEDALTVFESRSADITRGLGNVEPNKIIDPKNEDPAFFNEFTRVIDNAY